MRGQGTGLGPPCHQRLGPVQVPTPSISWHQPVPPPRRQDLLHQGYYLFFNYFFFYFFSKKRFAYVELGAAGEQRKQPYRGRPRRGGTSSCAAARRGPSIAAGAGEGGPAAPGLPCPDTRVTGTRQPSGELFSRGRQHGRGGGVGFHGRAFSRGKGKEDAIGPSSAALSPGTRASPAPRCSPDAASPKQLGPAERQGSLDPTFPLPAVVAASLLPPAAGSR